MSYGSEVGTYQNHRRDAEQTHALRQMRKSQPYVGEIDFDAMIRNVYALRVGDLVSTRRRNTELPSARGNTESLRQRIERERQELELAVTALAAQLARRTSQLNQLNTFPTVDPCKDGDTLRFEMTFPSSPDKKYSYVALRIDGLYYVTGARSPQGVTWDEFVSWCGLGVRSIRVHRPSGDGTAVVITEMLHNA